MPKSDCSYSRPTVCLIYHRLILFYADVIVLCYVIVMLYLGVVLSTCTAPGGSCVMPSIVFTECRGYRPHTVGYAIS